MTPFQRYLSLTVGRLDRATPLAATTGLPRKCLVFADDGSIQAIDANGVLRNITSSGGSLIPTDDNVDDLGSLALRWQSGFFGTSVSTPALAVQSGSGAASQAVAYLDAAVTSVNQLRFAATATGNAPAVTSYSVTDANVGLRIVPQGTGSISIEGRSIIVPTAVATGTQTALTVTGAANTGVTAATEAIDVNINLGRSVTWAAGAGPLASQRAVSIAAPTYVGNAGTPLVITNAATLYIDDAPTQGANMTLTNRYALLVAAGNVRFGDNIITGGNLSFAGAAPSITATAANQGIALASNGNGAITLDAGAGTGGVQIGVNAASLVGLYAAAPVARAAAITPIGAFTDPPSAAEMALLRTGVNAIITALQNIGVTL